MGAAAGIGRAALTCVAIAASATVLAACAPSACHNEVLSGSPSPDGVYIAFVYHRRCGEGVLTTEVTVIDFHGTLHDEPGNVLAANGAQAVRLSWPGPTTLLVTGFTDATTRHAHPKGPITAEFH